MPVTLTSTQKKTITNYISQMNGWETTLKRYLAADPVLYAAFKKDMDALEAKFGALVKPVPAPPPIVDPPPPPPPVVDPPLPPTDPTTKTWTVKRVKLGCGGWTTGGAVSDDGSTLCAKADAWGAYVFNDATDQWEDMIEYGKVPDSVTLRAGWDGTVAGGTLEVCPAPNAPNTIYYAAAVSEAGVGWAVRVFKTTNKGLSSVLLPNFAPGSSGDGNGLWRQYGPKMAVDPVNSNIAIIGLQGYGGEKDGGTYITLDGGMTWAEQNSKGLPKPANGTAMTGILFDRASVSNGRCQTIYAFSGGNGLYRTLNGGSSWALFAPLSAVAHVCDAQQSRADNTIYMAPEPGYAPGVGMGWRIVGGKVTQLPKPDWPDASCLVPHSTIARCVVALGQNGAVNISYDSGNTWAGWDYDVSPKTPEIPWLDATAGSGYLNTTKGLIDPSVGKPRSGKLICYTGLGVTRSLESVPSSGAFTHNVTYMTKGIELLCATSAVHPPGGKFQLTVQDKRNFSITDVDVMNEVYPSKHGFGKWKTGTAIEYGTDCTYAKSNPNFLCGTSGYFSNDDGYSLDGGDTWITWSTDPVRENIPDGASFINGCMAAATDQNIIWWPTNRKGPIYTKDRGATWKPLNVGGNSGTGKWCYDAHWANWVHRHFIEADDVNIGTYLAVIQGGSVPESTEVAGLWLSTNFGDTWTKIRPGNLFPFFWHHRLRHVNSISGAYLFTTGAQSGEGVVGPLYKIQVADGGKGAGAPTVTEYPGVVEAIDIAIGKKMPGKTWPRVWFVGWLNPPSKRSAEGFGVYYTDDGQLDNPPWTKVSSFAPANHLNAITCLAASTENADLAVVGFGSSGFVQLSAA